jgi:tetratricopeptide (TPR) repeat protein
MKKAVLVIFMFVAVVSPAVASEIEGRVRLTGGGSLVKRATAQLLRNGVVVEERLVSSDGRFEFRSLPVGTYTVRVRAEGFLDEEISTDLRRNDFREVVSMELRPVARKPEGPALTVSAADFQIPRDAKRDFEQGLDDRKHGQCAKALPRFQKAISAFDRYGDAYNEMGYCLKELGRIADAENALKKAVEYTSTIYAPMNLADLYATQKRFADAAAVLQRSIERNPSQGDLYFAMARVHFDQGQMKEAEAAGIAAHQKIHRSADVHLLLAKVYLSRQNYAAVTDQLRLYLDENPKGDFADRVRKNLEEMTRAAAQPASPRK